MTLVAFGDQRVPIALCEHVLELHDNAISTGTYAHAGEICDLLETPELATKQQSGFRNTMLCLNANTFKNFCDNAIAHLTKAIQTLNQSQIVSRKAHDVCHDGGKYALLAPAVNTLKKLDPIDYAIISCHRIKRFVLITEIQLYMAANVQYWHCWGS